MLKDSCIDRRAREILRCARATPQWPDVLARYVGLRRKPWPLRFVTRRGSVLDVADRDEMTTVWHVFFGNDYFVPLNSRTIFDLGANIGAFTVWAAEWCPTARIVSLEPFPETFARLASNVAQNQLHDRVTCLPVAIGGADRVAKFDATKGKRSYCRTLVPESDTRVDTVDVECLSLQTLFDRFELGEVDCLKLDIEGAEYETLLAAEKGTLRQCQVITLEFHEASRADALWTKLLDSGFQCVRFRPTGWSGVATYERIE